MLQRHTQTHTNANKHTHFCTSRACSTARATISAHAAQPGQHASWKRWVITVRASSCHDALVAQPTRPREFTRKVCAVLCSAVLCCAVLCPRSVACACPRDVACACTVRSTHCSLVFLHSVLRSAFLRSVCLHCTVYPLFSGVPVL